MSQNLFAFAAAVIVGTAAATGAVRAQTPPPSNSIAIHTTDRFFDVCKMIDPDAKGIEIVAAINSMCEDPAVARNLGSNSPWELRIDLDQLPNSFSLKAPQENSFPLQTTVQIDGFCSIVSLDTSIPEPGSILADAKDVCAEWKIAFQDYTDGAKNLQAEFDEQFNEILRLIYLRAVSHKRKAGRGKTGEMAIGKLHASFEKMSEVLHNPKMVAMKQVQGLYATSKLNEVVKEQVANFYDLLPSLRVSIRPTSDAPTLGPQ